MIRKTLAALAAAALLAGCPLPQPLPDYPKGTVTPPRILTETVTVNGVDVSGIPIVRVPIGCSTSPTYTMAAQLFDNNNLEQVEARWFIDYVPTNQIAAHPIQDDLVPASADRLVLLREVPPFTLLPYQIDNPPVAGRLHVVELVVSNNFATPAQTAPLPYRSPTTGFETQVYRWTFLLADGTDGCPTGT